MEEIVEFLDAYARKGRFISPNTWYAWGFLSVFETENLEPPSYFHDGGTNFGNNYEACLAAWEMGIADAKGN